MEKLIHLKEQIEKLESKLKAYQEKINANKKLLETAKKTDDELQQTLHDRNQLIDKVTKAEIGIEQLINKINKTKF